MVLEKRMVMVSETYGTRGLSGNALGPACRAFHEGV